jgi:hypothetical protein
MRLLFAGSAVAFASQWAANVAADSYLDGACVRLLADFARKERALAGCSALEISRKQHLSLARSAGSARQPVGRQRPRRF